MNSPNDKTPEKAQSSASDKVLPAPGLASAANSISHLMQGLPATTSISAQRANVVSLDLYREGKSIAPRREARPSAAPVRRPVEGYSDMSVVTYPDHPGLVRKAMSSGSTLWIFRWIKPTTGRPLNRILGDGSLSLKQAVALMRDVAR